MDPQTLLCALADNLKELMRQGAARNQPASQAELARRSGVAQATLSNWLDPTRGVSPKLDMLPPVAKVYGLQVWQLLIPGMARDMGRAKKLKRLVDNYQHIQCPNARQYIERIAEAEANYSPSEHHRRDEE